MKKNSKILQNLLLFGVFGFYLIILCTLLFFSRYSHRSVNIVPFRSILDFLSSSNGIVHSFSFTNIFGNIILFVPLGIYLTLLRHDKRVWTNTLLVFLISASV